MDGINTNPFKTGGKSPVRDPPQTAAPPRRGMERGLTPKTQQPAGRHHHRGNIFRMMKDTQGEMKAAALHLKLLMAYHMKCTLTSIQLRNFKTFWRCQARRGFHEGTADRRWPLHILKACARHHSSSSTSPLKRRVDSAQADVGGAPAISRRYSFCSDPPRSSARPTYASSGFVAKQNLHLTLHRAACNRGGMLGDPRSARARCRSRVVPRRVVRQR